MITDTEIRSKGVQTLATHLGDVEMGRFIALIQREPFDYTKCISLHTSIRLNINQ